MVRYLAFGNFFRIFQIQLNAITKFRGLVPFSQVLSKVYRVQAYGQLRMDKLLTDKLLVLMFVTKYIFEEKLELHLIIACDP